MDFLQRLLSHKSFVPDHVNNNNQSNCALASNWNNGLPDYILENIFYRCKGNDLKNCRQVCKSWSLVASQYLLEKTCATYDCSKENTKLNYFRSTLTTLRLVRFLSKSETGFNEWNEIRVKSVQSGGLDIFLKKLPQGREHFQTITILEVSTCTVKWSSFLTFLRLFDNLKSYTDRRNFHTFDNFCITLWSDQQTIFENWEKKFGIKPFPISSLKITKKDVNFNLNTLLKLFLRTVKELETFELILVNNDFGFLQAVDRTEFVTVLGFFLTRQTKLQHLTLDWICSRSNYYFGDFIQCLGILFMADLQLTGLNLQFEWIALNNEDIDTLFIPFLHRFVHLKKLRLGKIVLYAESAHRLQQLRPVNSPDCDCEFAIVFSDHLSLESHQQILQVIEGTSVMTDCVHSIRISVSDMYTTDLSQMMSLMNGVIIPLCTNTKELVVNLSWFPLGTDFNSFNMMFITLAYPNLTTLWIFDGPRFIYKGQSKLNRQCEKMTPATIGNSEMQMIIEDLPNLKNLRLRVRMLSLADCGLTGLTPEACERMIKTRNFSNAHPIEDFCGSPISKLRYLEDLMLKGVGFGVTDVTIHMAFNNMPQLKRIYLFGAMKFTHSARQLLTAMFPQSEGCSVSMN